MLQFNCQYEEGTGKMSPLSQVKKLLKFDIDDLKKVANKAYFKQLTQKQIQLHEQQKNGDNSPLTDPLIYYENRYFPFGFDDPDRVNKYQRDKANESKMSGKDSQCRAAIKDSIKNFERICAEQHEKEVEKSIEDDYTLRQQSIGGPQESVDNQSIKKHNKSTMSAASEATVNQSVSIMMLKDKKLSSLETNRGFIEKYLKSNVGGQSKPSNRSLLTSSMPGSPAVTAQWAASGKNISQYASNSSKRDTQYSTRLPGIGKRSGNFIMSGETVLLGQSNNDSIFSPISHIRNGSMNRFSSNQNPATTSTTFKARRSRDIKEELIKQRIETSLRLESLNIKVPKVWRQKEEAFNRLKQASPR